MFDVSCPCVGAQVPRLRNGDVVEPASDGRVENVIVQGVTANRPKGVCEGLRDRGED